MRLKLSITACAMFFFALMLLLGYRLSFADCDYGEYRYDEHASTCQSGHRYQCEDGTWMDLSVECDDETPTSASADQDAQSHNN